MKRKTLPRGIREADGFLPKARAVAKVECGGEGFQGAFRPVYAGARVATSNFAMGPFRYPRALSPGCICTRGSS